MECRWSEIPVSVRNPPWTFVIVLLSISNLPLASFGQETSELEGHLEAIFSVGTRHDVPTFEGFPSPKDFYTDYALPAKPVLFKNAAKKYPAFLDWDDDYFLGFPESEEEMVVVEREKKENRTRHAERMSFADFVRIHRSEETYLVNSLPPFLKEDVLLPLCLSCKDIIQGNLVSNLLWFSSGGTKSVLHTDSADNILCLIRGKKDFFLVDKKYAKQVNVTERGYSGVDVDRVDLTKYPGLHKLEHYYAALQAGDCLYVPFLWIHHVRSYEENIAVNLWWREDLDVDFNTCSNTAVTFEGLQFIGFGGLYESQFQMIKNRLAGCIERQGSLTVASLMDLFDEPDLFGPDLEWTDEMTDIVIQVIEKMDKLTLDEKVELEELESLKLEDWAAIRNLLNDMSLLLDGYDDGSEGEDSSEMDTAAQGGEGEESSEMDTAAQGGEGEESSDVDTADQGGEGEKSSDVDTADQGGEGKENSEMDTAAQGGEGEESSEMDTAAQGGEGEESSDVDTADQGGEGEESSDVDTADQGGEGEENSEMDTTDQGGEGEESSDVDTAGKEDNKEADTTREESTTHTEL